MWVRKIKTKRVKCDTRFATYCIVCEESWNLDLGVGVWSRPLSWEESLQAVRLSHTKRKDKGRWTAPPASSSQWLVPFTFPVRAVNPFLHAAADFLRSLCDLFLPAPFSFLLQVFDDGIKPQRSIWLNTNASNGRVWLQPEDSTTSMNNAPRARGAGE
jgi:hypothetical protein